MSVASREVAAIRNIRNSWKQELEQGSDLKDQKGLTQPRELSNLPPQFRQIYFHSQKVSLDSPSENRILEQDQGIAPQSQRFSITSIPPMNGCNTSGTATLPSARWCTSSRGMRMRGEAMTVLLRVWTKRSAPSWVR